MAINDVYRLTRQCYVDGEAHFNVFHFQDKVGSPDPEADLMNEFDAPSSQLSLNAKIRQAMDGAGTISEDETLVQRITPTVGDAIPFSPTAYTYDTLESGLPTFCAVVHQLKTGFASRSKRGRFYIGALPEAHTNGNVIAGTLDTAHEGINVAVRDFFIEGGTSYNGWVMGVWSRLLSEFTPVTAIGHSQTIATLRRRKKGRGI